MIITLLVGVAGCDSEGSDSCSEGTEFFPAAVGDVWTFETEFGTRSTRSVRTSGSTTWAFLESECEAGVRSFSVWERFEGEQEVPMPPDGSTISPASFQRRLTFTVGDDLILDRYTLAPITLPTAQTAPDTLVSRQSTGLRAGGRSQTLVRGHGVAQLTYSQTVSAGGNSEYERLDRVGTR